MTGQRKIHAIAQNTRALLYYLVWYPSYLLFYYYLQHSHRRNSIKYEHALAWYRFFLPTHDGGGFSHSDSSPAFVHDNWRDPALRSLLSMPRLSQ